MGQFLIVSKADKLAEYKKISEEYDVAFELNDFYVPEILDDEEKLNSLVEEYRQFGIPDGSTMHGVFYDIAIFSQDKSIRDVSKKRMEQSMEVAKRLGLKGVVFHANYNPGISDDEYVRYFISKTVKYLSKLLDRYPDVDIYLENMFETDPYILKEISRKLKKYPNYGLCLDWAHANVFGRDIEEWGANIAEYVKHIHINDNDLINDLHLAVGSGMIDWQQFLDYYNTYFSDCSVLIETNEPKDQIVSLEYIKKGCAEKRSLTAEEMLEKIFYYMSQLAVEKDYSKSILLLTDLGRTLVNAERTSFWYRDVKNKQYWTLAASETGRIVVPQGRGIIGASIENNETILIPHPYEDPRFNSQVDKETGFVTKNILCMPIVNSSGEVIGAYQAINKLGEGDACCFDEQDKSRLALAAAYSGKLLETHLLREQSQLDHLTGLKNRRGFYDCYTSQILHSEKSQTVSLIMCDIDHFKKVNDTYGHNAGDEVLVHVADILQKIIGKKGEVFRWGGEEFIIILPQCDLEQAADLAEEIRCKIMESECHSENHIIKTTMSFGVSELKEGKTPEENVKDVDEKMYEAKQGGRNRVIK